MLLDGGLFKYVCPLLPSCTKGLGELNIAKLKFVNWTSKIEKIVDLKMANE